eukprot:CAMPEP_0178921928 /NCGR_PEP_ID=MMETSP0786-20121207/15843_1 /TAXON_ID=186022 /ORGANISM="Thalassionema frauenfeldii, Strain CCMP 1798" /LENGTH=161 /DNA_ID=CAMNT_0020596181 /DNA_START=669 /DNA_END=1151 /DNA_ORIENTATION=-
MFYAAHSYNGYVSPWNLQYVTFMSDFNINLAGTVDMDEQPPQVPQSQNTLVPASQVAQSTIKTQIPSITKAAGYVCNSAKSSTTGQVPMPKSAGPKPQEDRKSINCFSLKQTETQIKSLNKGFQLPPQKLKMKCLKVLKVLQAHPHGWVFNTPVDSVELGL